MTDMGQCPGFNMGSVFFICFFFPFPYFSISPVRVYCIVN